MRPERAVHALVTGGAGFIGSTLVDRLLADAWTVTVVDDFSTGTLSNLEDAAAAPAGALEIERADVTDPSVIALVEARSPDVIFHLAAQCDVRTSVRDPAGDALTNVIGTINILEGARRAHVPRVVFASSGGTIYGEPPAELLPLREDTPKDPLSPYGIAKEAAGHYVHAYSTMHGLTGTTLALANVYGPRQPPHGEAGVVAIFAGLLAAGEPCTIYGSGEQTRDFVFVDDVVDAFVRAARRGAVGLFNIGTGCEVTVNELHAEMAEIWGVRPQVRSAPARPGELDRNCLDNGRAREVLGWSPTTSLEEGLRLVFRSLAARQESR
jgi:UDP-glucose 4-epimerase